MDEIEQQIEQQAQQMLQPKEEDNSVNTIIEQKIKDTNDVKSVIDFYATTSRLSTSAALTD